MNATIFPEKENHYPVLLNEIISIITPQYGGTFIDCTFGQGGYTKKILEFANTRVIALDRDKDSAKIALEFEKKFKNSFGVIMDDVCAGLYVVGVLVLYMVFT